MILEAINNYGEYWYIAPTYRQAKTIAWRMLVKQWHALPEQYRGQKNESELWVDILGSRISLKGSDNEDSLRGSGLSGIVCDEVDSYNNWDVLWEESLRPALTDKKGFAWFVGTPKGFRTLHNLSLKEGIEYAYFHFTSYDNPTLDKLEIEQAKKELSEDAFAQEYLAEFKKFTGLIYKEFSRDIHIIDTAPIQNWPRERGMDFGALNPTVCLWATFDRDDNMYIYDEYYQNEKTTEFHANVVKAKTQYDQINFTWGDPSGEQQVLDYASYGVYISPAPKIYSQEMSWVRSGIDKIKFLLKVSPITGKPRLFIYRTCKNLIREFESYQWLNKQEMSMADANEREVPLKKDDHGMDALRYLTEGHYAGKVLGEKKLTYLL